MTNIQRQLDIEEFQEMRKDNKNKSIRFGHGNAAQFNITHSDDQKSPDLEQFEEKLTDASAMDSVAVQIAGQVLTSSPILSDAQDESCSSAATDSVQKISKPKPQKNMVERKYKKLAFTDEEKQHIGQMKENLVHLYHFSQQKALRLLWKIFAPQADFRTFKSQIKLQKKKVKKRGIKSRNGTLDKKIVKLACYYREQNPNFKVSQTFIKFGEEIFSEMYLVKRNQLHNKKSSIEKELEQIDEGRRKKPSEQCLKSFYNEHKVKIYQVIGESKNAKKYQKFNCL